MRDVLAMILGGGRGSRLFPLTHARAKPAVPIGGRYRLIDIPISNCLHSEIRRILVLTQFNSASLNRHVAQSYRLDGFSSNGFVEILAAEQTPDSSHWFQGTADAVRQARRHFEPLDADYYLILAGDHLYRMNYEELIDAHTERGSDITIAAQPVTPEDATQMGIFRFDRTGQIVAFEEKPDAARLNQIGASVPQGSVFMSPSAEMPFVASMGIYVFSRQVLLEVLERPGVDFGREIIPGALDQYKVTSFLHRDYWADVGTIEAYYDASLMLTQAEAPFRLVDPARPIFTRPRQLPPARVCGGTLHNVILGEGSTVEDGEITDSIVGVRAVVRPGARVSRSVLIGSDFYELASAAPAGLPRIGIGRDVVLDRAIVDKNARIGDGVRLTNERNVQEADGDCWHIRGGIIVVPKGGVVAAGTVV